MGKCFDMGQNKSPGHGPQVVVHARAPHFRYSFSTHNQVNRSHHSFGAGLAGQKSPVVLVLLHAFHEEVRNPKPQKEIPGALLLLAGVDRSTYPPPSAPICSPVFSLRTATKKGPSPEGPHMEDRWPSPNRWTLRLKSARPSCRGKWKDTRLAGA